jgi:hypothetical protein
MKEIPILKASDIEARVQQVFTNARGASAMLLLYKSARTDMRILDDVYGPMNWKRAHEVINGSMFCTISIWDEEKKEWISKQDVGVPSNRDSKKGEASDAFKRAGFNWGIGRELYDAPTIFVSLDPSELNGEKLKSSVGFVVTEVAYDRATHSFRRLVISDRNGRVRWEMGAGGTSTQSPAPAGSSGNLERPASQLREEIRAELVKNGIDPDAFARRTCGVSFDDIPPAKLESLAANFNASVDWFKTHT